MKRRNAEARRIKEGTPMKVVILAGGFGTRISEESHLKAEADGGDRNSLSYGT